MLPRIEALIDACLLKCSRTLCGPLDLPTDEVWLRVTDDGRRLLPPAGMRCSTTEATDMHATTMTREQLEQTPWAQSFKEEAPVSYAKAIKLAQSDSLAVTVERGKTVLGDPRFVIVAADHEPEFWMEQSPPARKRRRCGEIWDGASFANRPLDWECASGGSGDQWWG